MRLVPLILLLVLVSACGSGDSATDASTEAPAEAAWPTPIPSDVSTLDGIMRAYYEVVSGPAGQVRDWNRDKSLHLPGAQVVITRTAEDGSLRIDQMTISDYHDRQPGPAQNAFYEVEINRLVRQHGSTVHVWSTYEYRSTPDGPAEGQGVNSIELIWDGTRYWIASWGYDGRMDAPPVPSEYLPAAGA